jgi:hypothetical protein
MLCGADGSVISSLTDISVPTVLPSSFRPLPDPLDIDPAEFHFVKLYLFDDELQQRSASVSWLADNQDLSYAPLRRLKKVTLDATGDGTVDPDGTCRVQVSLYNPADVMAFFVRLQALRKSGGERMLPVFYDDNYVTIMPGETVTVDLECRVNRPRARPFITYAGWNTIAALNMAPDALANGEVAPSPIEIPIDW